MANDTLELECPSCSELLELDGGFAGGVCRCFNCGTMMTVPNNPSREKAEKLVRPDAPGGGVAEKPGRPEAPGGGATAPSESSLGNPPPVAANVGSAAPVGSDPVTAANTVDETAASTVPAGEYVTASGKTVHVDSETAVPTATRRRMGVRAITLGVIILLMLLLLGGTIAAVVLVVNSSGDDDLRTDRYEDVFGYDPEVNPFTLTRPNVLGLPLADNAAIVIDTSRSRWLTLGADGILAGIEPVSSGDQLTVVLAREGAPTSLPAEAKPWSDEVAKPIMDELRGLRAVGRADLAPAVVAAIEREPEQVVLVSGQNPFPDEIAALEDALKDSGIQFDVIVVNDDSPELSALAEKFGGRSISFSLNRLSGWYQEADAAGRSE